MKNRIAILATVAVAFSLSAASCEQVVEQRLLPDPLPPPECPFLGGCTDDNAPPAPTTLPDPNAPCGLGGCIAPSEPVDPAPAPPCGLGDPCLGQP